MPELEITLVYTNATVPQCRAVGRFVALLQIERMLCNDTEPMPEQHRQLYFGTIPSACGLDANDESTKANLAAEWTELKKLLPVFSESLKEYDQAVSTAAAECRFIRNYLDAIEKEAAAGTANHLTGHRAPEIPRPPQLHAKTIRYDDVPAWKSNQARTAESSNTVHAISAYPLDTLFESLRKRDPYDPAVGFWLHVLPGESLEGSNPPIISVFFCDGQDVVALEHDLVRWCTEHIDIKPRQPR